MLDLSIFVLNHTKSDIIEPKVRMEVHHPSSHRVLCTSFPEPPITRSHLKLPQKLFDNSVSLQGVFQKSGKPFSIFSPVPQSALAHSYSLFWTQRKCSLFQEDFSDCTCSTCPLCCIIRTGSFPWTVSSVRAGPVLALSLCLSVCHTAGTSCALRNMHLIIHRGKQEMGSYWGMATFQ